MAARLADVPMVYHVHSPASAQHRPAVAELDQQYYRAIQSAAGKPSDRGFPKSQRAHDPARFRCLTITVVPNGVPALYEIPFRRPPRGQWTLGTAALFRPRKGIEVLLRAMALMRNRGLSVRLLAVGEFESPKYEREIHALAARSGLGRHHPVDGLYQRRDIRTVGHGFVRSAQPVRRRNCPWCF